MSIMYVRNKSTGKFEPVKSIQGAKGDPGTVENVTITSINGLPEALAGKLGKTEPAADSAKLNGEYAAAYLLAKSFDKFKYVYLNEPDTNIATDDVPKEHWEEVPTGNIFVAYVTRSGAVTTVIGLKVSALYGMYINLSYSQAPYYYKLYNGTWSKTAIIQDLSTYATKDYVSTAITEALNAIQNASGVSF